MASDERVKRSTDPARETRAMEDRAVTENREVTDTERRMSFRSEYLTTALPNPPKIPGYHCIWLSTTNQQNPIHSYIRLGYEPVRVEEIATFKFETIKSGDWQGCIGVNEMILFKLPEELYFQYMKELYHDAPMDEEERLRSNIENIKDQLNRIRSHVEVEEGMRDLAKPADPVFGPA